MASTKLADLLVKIKADSTEFQKGVRQVQRHTQQLAGNLQSVGTVFAGIGAAGVGAFTLLSREAIAFESAFAGVKKTLDGTPAEFAALEQEFRKLATQIPVSANELARIGEIAGQLGIEKQNVVAFTEVVAKLGVSSNLAGEEGATMLARFANIAGVDETKYENLASTIIDLGNNSATTERDIGELALRLAGAGSAAGISAPAILGMAAALSSVGVNAEAGGTAFSKLIIDIQAAVETGSADLQSFAAIAGTSAGEFARIFKEDGAQAIDLFIKGLAGIQASGGSVVAALDSVGISEARMRDAILRSTQASDDFTGSLSRANTAFQAGNALQTEAAQRFGTTESQLQLLSNQIRDIALTVGPPLLQVLRDIVETVRPVVLAVGEWVAANPQLAATLVTVGAGVSAVALGAGGLAASLGLVIAGITPLIPYFIRATAALSGYVQVSALLVASGIGPFFASLGPAIAVAATALAAFKLGQWAADNIPPVAALGDAIANLILKIPGLKEALTGVEEATGGLEYQVYELEKALAAKGVTVERAGRTAIEYSKALRQAGVDAGLFGQKQTEAGGKVDATGGKVDDFASKLRSSLSSALNSSRSDIDTFTGSLIRNGQVFDRFSTSAPVVQLDAFSQAQARATSELQFFQNQAPQFNATVNDIAATISSMGNANQQAALEVENLGRIMTETAAEQAAQARQTLDNAGAFEKLDTSVQKPKASMGQLAAIGRQVSTVFTDFGKDIARLIVDGGSLGDVFKSLGESLLRLVAEQAMGALINQLGKLISLIPGLNGVRDVLGGIFGVAGGAVSAAGGIAGGAGQVAGAAGQVAGAAGAAGSAGSAASSAASGALSSASMITGIVTGIVSSITGVIGIFQTQTTNDRLKLIEESTRRGTLFLGDRGDGGILGQLFKLNEEVAFGTGNKALLDIKDRLSTHIGPIEWAAKAIETKLGTWEQYIMKLATIDSNIAALSGAGAGFGGNVTIQVAGSVVAEQDLVTLVANELDRRAASA